MARVTGFAFGPRSHSAGVGTRSVVSGEWLQRDDEFDADIAAKGRLLAQRRDQVLFEPGQSRAGDELLAAVRLFRDEQGWPTLDVPASGGPVEAAARLVQEDVCLMERDAEGAWALAAACVCSPSHWDLRDKAGQSMSAIHGTVPRYADRLAAATDQLFDRMAARAGEPGGDRVLATEVMQRFNWTLADSPDPFAPSASGRRQGWATPVVKGELFLRVERQTLRVLPASGAIVFTIRTGIQDVLDLPAAEMAALRATVAQVDEQTAAYRSWPVAYRSLIHEV